MSQAFTTLTATCCPFYKDDVDTDQIIPARFLKGTTKEGFGENVFYDWRYDENGSLKPDSVFNQTTYQGSQVLVSGINFGCGSSREHAPWALKDFGFRAVIAVSFADIFYNNALKNSLLPVPLPQATIEALLARIEADPGTQVTIDLSQQTVLLPDGTPDGAPDGATVPFEINPFRKECLLKGLDDIGFVLSHLDTIEAYEAAHSK